MGFQSYLARFDCEPIAQQLNDCVRALTPTRRPLLSAEYSIYQACAAHNEGNVLKNLLAKLFMDSRLSVCILLRLAVAPWCQSTNILTARRLERCVSN